MTNIALREFTRKVIKNKLQAFFWSFKKQQKIKQKSDNNLKVFPRKRNRNRVEFIEVKANYRSAFNTNSNSVKGLDRVSRIRATLPDIDI